MADMDIAVATQLANIEKRTGKTLPELAAIVKGSGLTRPGELVIGWIRTAYDAAG
jgi:hypothetical protein